MIWVLFVDLFLGVAAVENFRFVEVLWQRPRFSLLSFYPADKKDNRCKRSSLNSYEKYYLSEVIANAVFREITNGFLIDVFAPRVVAAAGLLLAQRDNIFSAVFGESRKLGLSGNKSSKNAERAISFASRQNKAGGNH